jgi:NifU-like protein involved in Fe-S cluster formation
LKAACRPGAPPACPWRAEVRFTPATIEHFQHPRNVGRLSNADAIGRVDDAETDTMVELYVKLDGRRVSHATFRTFGCSACIAASSVATELLAGRAVPPTADEIDAALGGLPIDKRYCAELVAEAARRALAPPHV